MKTIKLNKGYETIVDDDTYEWASKLKWQVDGGIYVGRRSTTINGKRPNVKLHRLIMNAPKGINIDHINGDRLDNRRENLRFATDTQNNQNCKKRKDNISGYKGVTYTGRYKIKNWQARITYNNKTISLGLYQTKEEAALVYNIAALKLFGEFAKLNILPSEPGGSF
jgi:hypothetical protein